MNRDPLPSARAEVEVRSELHTAGGLAERTLESYRGWTARYTAWCDLQQLVPFPVDDEVAQLFLHAHYPRWPYTYAKTLPRALSVAHAKRDLPAPKLDGLADYLKRLSRDSATPAPQPKITPLRVKEAGHIHSAEQKALPRDPRTVRVRAVLVVSAVAGLPLLDVPLRELNKPTTLTAERLTAASFTVTPHEIRLMPPGREIVLIDVRRDPIEYQVLAAALAEPANSNLPLSGPPGENRQLAAAAALRCGLSTTSGLQALSRDELHLLLAHVDGHHQRRVRNWAYAMTGLYTTCRHDELSQFAIEAVESTPQGYEVAVDHTKNYPQGQTFPVRHAADDPVTCHHPLCPACAMREQLALVREVHGRTTGPLFATRYGNEWRAMTRQNGRLVVKGLWDRAGLPKGKRVATRALRSGGITSASEAGWQRWQIADELSGHRDLNVLEVYVHILDPFANEFFLPV